MKTNSVPTSQTQMRGESLAARFAAYRRKTKLASLGAVALLSTSTLRSMNAADDRDTNQRVSRMISEKSRLMEDSTAAGDEVTLTPSLARFAPDDMPDELPRSYVLNAAERAELAAVWRPALKREVSAIAPDESEALPADFVPLFVSDYAPLMGKDAEIEAQAAAEAAAEIAAIESAMEAEFQAVNFDSEPFAGIPTDFAPYAPRFVRPIMPQVAAKMAAPAVPACVSQHEALRLAVLGIAQRARMNAAKRG